MYSEPSICARDWGVVVSSVVVVVVVDISPGGRSREVHVAQEVSLNGLFAGSMVFVGRGVMGVCRPLRLMANESRRRAAVLRTNDVRGCWLT